MAEQVSHTPGPWHVWHTTNVTTLLESGRPERIVANCGVFSDGREADSGYEENEANARLIAAAPELLAALHAVLNWFTPPNDSAAFPTQQVAEAINKATGKP